jgi:hypothetical protein
MSSTYVRNIRKFMINHGGAVEQSDGSYLNGGTVRWYNEVGERHKEDGPAITTSYGDIGWWLNNTAYSFDEWCNKLNKSDEEKMLLWLQYA